MSVSNTPPKVPTVRRGSAKKLNSWGKLKAAQALNSSTTEEPSVSQRTLDRVTREREEFRKKFDAAQKDNAAIKSKLRNVTEKVIDAMGSEQEPPASPEGDAANIPEQEILEMINRLIPIESNQSLESRLEELETRVTMVDGELGKLLQLKLKMERELHQLESCQDLETIHQGIRQLWLQSCSTRLFSKDPFIQRDYSADKRNPTNELNNDNHNGIPPSVKINLEPVHVIVPPHKLPAETHVRDMQADLRKLVIQELSLYKGNGADWRLFAQRVGVPEDLVTQWQQMKVQQPMKHVLAVWTASNAATVRMLHRHLVSPQMRCVVLGKRISDVYQVD